MIDHSTYGGIYSNGSNGTDVLSINVYINTNEAESHLTCAYLFGYESCHRVIGDVMCFSPHPRRSAP